MTHQYLGDLLVAKKIITQQQLDKALAVQQGNHEERLLGQILVELGLITYSELLRVASHELHIPRAEAALKIRARLKAQIKTINGSGQAEEVFADASPTAKNPVPGKDFPDLDLTEIESLPPTRGDELQLIIMIQDMLVEGELHDSRMFIEDGLANFPESSRLRWLQLWHRIKSHSWVHFLNEYEDLDDMDKQNQGFQMLNVYRLLSTGQFDQAIPLLESLAGSKRKQGKSYRLYLLAYCLYQVDRLEQSYKIFYQFVQENKGSENRWVIAAREYLNKSK